MDSRELAARVAERQRQSALTARRAGFELAAWLMGLVFIFAAVGSNCGCYARGRGSACQPREAQHTGPATDRTCEPPR